MKHLKILIAINFMLITVMSVKAQDIITKKNGDDLKAKVLEVNQTEIKYKKFESPNGATYTMLKSEIMIILYADGTKDIFNEEKNPPQPQPQKEKEKEVAIDNTKNEMGLSMSELGKEDAKHNYRKYHGAVFATVICSVLDPAIGLIPAISCSSRRPGLKYLHCPNPQLFESNIEYRTAYTEKAFKMKRHKVWTGFTVGSITSFIIGAAIVASSGH